MWYGGVGDGGIGGGCVGGRSHGRDAVIGDGDGDRATRSRVSVGWKGGLLSRGSASGDGGGVVSDDVGVIVCGDGGDGGGGRGEPWFG